MFSLREKLERRRLGGLWSYSVAFTGLILVVLAIFYYFDRSFVWQPDGEDIYFVIFRYSRDYVYDVLKNLLHTGRLVLPEWDFSIGQGNNVLVGFHFSPFFLLGLLSPTKYLEYAYALMVVAQLYCTGAAFCLLCRRAGQTEPFPVALGAIVYTFSGFAFHAGYSHIYFVANMMLSLTLILLSAERYLQEGKWGLYVAVIAMTLLGGYYYAYMDTLLMTVYLVIRQLCVNGRDLRRSFLQLMRLFLYYLLGFALALFNFLPAVMNYFICARSGVQSSGTGMFYRLKNYLDMIASFASPQYTGSWHQLSFLGIALVALTLVFLRRERETKIVRISFVVCTVFFLLPICGKVFNGFGYVTNRWCYGYALCVAMAVVYGAKDLWKMTQRERRAVAIAAGVWMLASVCITRRYEVLTGVVLMGLTLLAVLPRDKSRYHDATQRRVAWVTGLAAVVHIFIFFLPPFQNEIGSYKEGGKVNSTIARSAEFAARSIDDDSFYRVEGPSNRYNRFVLAGVNGTNSYWSALPAKMTNYYRDFALASLRLSYAAYGLDQSTLITTLSGVKYVITNSGVGVPYGYTDAGEVKARSKSYALARNEYALPLGYSYGSVMTREEYLTLDPVQRQQAMLQRAVVDTVPEGMTASSPEITAQALPWTQVSIDKMTLQEDGTYLTHTNSTMVLRFQARPNAETWLYLDGMDALHRSNLTVTCGDISRTTFLYGPTGDHYFERDGVACNLGYGLEGEVEVKISLTRASTYHINPVIYALPMEDYVQDVTALGAQALEDITVSTDEVTGRVNLSEKRLMVFTIPHIGGWSATVDGVEQELLDVNTLYMGLVLEPGEHSIRLHYEMPGLRIGAGVSAAAAAGLALYGLGVKGRRRRGSRSRKNLEVSK